MYPVENIAYTLLWFRLCCFLYVISSYRLHDGIIYWLHKSINSHRSWKILFNNKFFSFLFKWNVCSLLHTSTHAQTHSHIPPEVTIRQSVDISVNGTGPHTHTLRSIWARHQPRFVTPDRTWESGGKVFINSKGWWWWLTVGGLFGLSLAAHWKDSWPE